VTTLSDISQEASISESIVNMDIVETYTDTLAAQLATEPSLNEESIPVEATSQVEEVHVESDAVAEVQETIAVDESVPEEESAIAEESSTVTIEEQVAELAYEEYLKDMAGTTNSLTDHVDEIQGEVPVTKVSKNGEVRIAMDTKNAHVWNELGNIYLNAGTWDDAMISYSKAIELDRHFAWPYSNLALAYVQKGRFAEAILLYQRGIELFTSDRDKAITWNRLGNVYRRINDYANAIAAYQTADELDPENATLSLRSSFGLLGNMYSDSKPAYVA
jgi:tetratricopeptide (TPR) repeat protein